MALRILALTRYGRMGASTRLRFLQYIPVLESRGFQVSVAPLLSDVYLRRCYTGQSPDWLSLGGAYSRRLFALLRVREFDLLWIEKELFPNLPAWAEIMLRRLRIPYVVDYDDAVFHNYDLGQHLIKKFMSRKIDRVMQEATLVVCGNTYLAERAQDAGAHCVEVVPTVIDLQKYSVRPDSLYESKRETITLGWVGSPATVKYLEGISQALQRLATMCPVRLHVIGAQYSVPGLEVECRTWHEESEASEIQKFDIGIMPLPDFPWERGKCGYKLIQYMACGLPVVASRVGANKTIVKDGVTGYLVRDMEENEWLAALESLCTDVEVRRNMGLQGRLAVEKFYCLQVTGPRVAKLLAEAAT